MDQQYSMTLGRPLGISGIGDCPSPTPLTTNPTVLRLATYIGQFTILSRQILSSDSLTTPRIDAFTDALLDLQATLPAVIQFDATWLDTNKEIPDWPLDAQAAVFYGKTHNYLILLNRQRQENLRRTSQDSALGATSIHSEEGNSSGMGEPSDPERGRDRVLSSCRALLHAFAFFNTRVRAAMVCWTMGQQAFNAAMILTLNMLETGDLRDWAAVTNAYYTFIELRDKGIHALAGLAVGRLNELFRSLKRKSGDSSRRPGGKTSRGHQPSEHVLNESQEIKECVMGRTGLILLEDPGLQGFVPMNFEPLSFRMAGTDLPLSGLGPAWAAAAAPRATAGYADRPMHMPVEDQGYHLAQQQAFQHTQQQQHQQNQQNQQQQQQQQAATEAQQLRDMQTMYAQYAYQQQQLEQQQHHDQHIQQQHQPQQSHDQQQHLEQQQQQQPYTHPHQQAQQYMQQAINIPLPVNSSAPSVHDLHLENPQQGIWATSVVPMHDISGQAVPDSYAAYQGHTHADVGNVQSTGYVLANNDDGDRQALLEEQLRVKQGFQQGYDQHQQQ